MSEVFTPTRYKWTVEDYHKLGEAGILTEDSRVELIEGGVNRPFAKFQLTPSAAQAPSTGDETPFSARIPPLGSNVEFLYAREKRFGVRLFEVVGELAECFVLGKVRACGDQGLRQPLE